ncbi:MAG: hypothetical protein ABJC63_15530 [Gemmatimonadales bacterium]
MSGSVPHLSRSAALAMLASIRLILATLGIAPITIILDRRARR